MVEEDEDEDVNEMWSREEDEGWEDLESGQDEGDKGVKGRGE